MLLGEIGLGRLLPFRRRTTRRRRLSIHAQRRAKALLRSHRRGEQSIMATASSPTVIMTCAQRTISWARARQRRKTGQSHQNRTRSKVSTKWLSRLSALLKACLEQANSLFTSILQAEVEPTSPQRPTSPTRQPTASTSALPSTPSRKRIFNYSTPSNPSTPSRRLDTPNDEAYQASPVRSESRQLLESPRRKLRSVCKTPYRVLDAPELAEDFYLNLVDWSSTNVLGVGLGSCVYLWAAHNASVSKLCDLSDNADVISSVSWVQKVLLHFRLSLPAHPYLRAQRSLSVLFRDASMFMMLFS